MPNPYKSVPYASEDADARFMRQALSLAARGQGNVEPNPMVGAVIVRDNRVIGTGYHRRFGDHHAEIWALREAGHRARGATLYVTLETCCHWGKTPPCTDAILAAGIRRVVIAMLDPFARVHGKGAALLRRRNVRVEVGLCEAPARELNAPYLTRLEQGRPYVIAKWAQSLDGCVATAGGESRWISSEASRAMVHPLRARVDGIVVGIGTALTDDPRLTARLPAGSTVRRLAMRIVIDSTCRLPLTSQLVKTVSVAPVMVAHRRNLRGAAEQRHKALAERGVMTVGLPVDRSRRVNVAALLRHLGRQEYTNVLLEGGPETMASFFASDLVDEAQVFIAPIIIGGPSARHAVGGGKDLARIADARRLRVVSAAPRGPDFHMVLRRP
jgi:diaminohydroxyphosphoribosylaminopyrimidine deaminase / 5-amino-6-(5-phosphoribosylamino)uracil reductase